MLQEFWDQQSADNPKMKKHPICKVPGYKSKAIPIFLHGDGAEYQHQDSLLTVSFCGVLKEGG
eukprot:5857987-Alexandrium_andersonii.AAC.1